MKIHNPYNKVARELEPGDLALARSDVRFLDSLVIDGSGSVGFDNIHTTKSVNCADSKTIVLVISMQNCFQDNVETAYVLHPEFIGWIFAADSIFQRIR